MAKVKVKTLQSVRLDGNDILADQIVEIDENILAEWLGKELATTNLKESEVKEQKQHEKKDRKKGSKTP